ncbi:MAG: CusA/CzcA family heavy metal efflux RND transporter [Gammaproteobacteria bacterium]|nr:CusA/CzcA family heavy metal efflux RND transporter [Gammaproteobacteria bacterium]MBU1654369.1 CusA/CzcA family heavy metal efflux RND transporter [Gammaproteobacteria bacterium]MBU1961996.1 CusA/CzcA family heavy metal efflux RND transporter [Gammaproteobacteria bacterium]
MIGHVIQWSLGNRLLVVAGALILLVWGGREIPRTPVDVFPDLTAPAVTVVTEAGGMNPIDMERLVTFPIETALNGAPGVRRVRSSTKIGLSVVSVEFAWGTDGTLARQVVAEKLQLAKAALPPDVEAPVMAPASSVMGEVMFIALTSDRHSTVEIKNSADQVLRKRLLAVPGVAEVLPIGGDLQQIQVRLKPERLAAYGLTIGEVVKAVSGANSNAAAGFYAENGQEYLIQGIGRVRRAEDVAEALVAVKNGQPVLIRHVADVALGVAVKRGIGSTNGKPAVVLGIQRQPAANTLELTRVLDDAIAGIQQSLPEGMRIENRLFRQADFIETSIANLLTALRDGAILVVAIVFAFLLSARSTAITLVALPLSLVVAVLSLKALGATINTMTLGGMAIALGALVDDAIIVVENIVRRLRENHAKPEGQRETTLHVVFLATQEIQGSILFATLIIMLVFVPLFFLSGIEGRLMVPLGLAYVISLFASLLVSISLTPVLASLFLGESPEVRTDHETRLIRWLHEAYRHLLVATLDRWRAISLASGALLIAALIGLGLAGQAFLPDFNEGTLTVGAETLPGTALDESAKLMQAVEEVLLSHPEVVATARRTGRSPLDPHALDVHQSEIEVTLKRGERHKADFLAALRADFSRLPGVQVVVGQPISHRIDHMLSGSRANIAVKIFGADLAELRRLAQRVQGVMARVAGAVDVQPEQQVDIPFLSIRYRRDALARHGLSALELSEAIETAFNGRVLSKVVQGQASLDLVVGYDPEARASLDAIRATLITTSSGARLPLSALADIENDRGPYFINRENVQRKIVVMANVAGRDLKTVVEEMQGNVAREVKLPAGYHIEFGGQFESAAEASRTLLLLGSAVVAGIFLLLYAAFHSVRDALLVMLNLPLAIIGGVAGVYAAGGVVTLASIIGFITLFGIATRNGVMMIAHIHHLAGHDEVRDIREAVARGAEERLIPILMTALAAGLALVPLALSAGEPGSEIQAPMAVVILCGLISSTLLNMLVVPALYLRFGALRGTLEVNDGG